MRAFVALGANLGDARATVLAAMEAIGALPSTRLLSSSSLYRSAPMDATGPDFINAVVELDTELQAHELLKALQQIESQAGRERPYRNAPRTLDLDLLEHGVQVFDTPDLVLPHPRMNERAFVLRPLAEIAPDRVSPAQLERVAGQAIEQL